jgi:ACS family hexuronate transporter-like MFS transporter
MNVTDLFAGEGRLASAKRNSRIKWMMLGFAFLATVINYLDRQTLSVMAPVLLEKFQITATSYSHII